MMSKTFCTLFCKSTSMTYGQKSGLPSYAGKSARMDFLLKTEQVVVETKKTRKGLDAKVLGDELLIDIQKISSAPRL